jgi:hypothetical protein
MQTASVWKWLTAPILYLPPHPYWVLGLLFRWRVVYAAGCGLQADKWLY